MERAAWLKQMRDKAEALYDHLSPHYWVTFGQYANETHREYLQKFLGWVAPRSTLLSAACGAGHYDGTLLEAGHSVVGIDQSAGMLAQAREKFPEAQYEKLGLQEMDYREAFDGAICIDAMEHVCPEDWPLILDNFHRALRPQGHLYLTVEIADESDIQKAFITGQQLALPVVYGESGEWADEPVYHYWPSMKQVGEWIAQAGFDLMEEGEGDSYHHFIIRKASQADAAQHPRHPVHVAQA